MTFSSEWEARFAQGKNNSLWPWSDLVSAVMRYRGAGSAPLRVLELGSGVGANTALFRELGAQYFAIEGSSAGVSAARHRFPEYADQIICGDFTAGFPFEGQFDLIVDRAALTHNPDSAIRRTLERVHQFLRPDGRYIGIDWFSTAHSEFSRGVPTDEPWTRTGYTGGPFVGLGRVHFSDEKHLRDLFGAFAIELLEEKLVERYEPDAGLVLASWNIVASKG